MFFAITSIFEDFNVDLEKSYNEDFSISGIQLSNYIDLTGNRIYIVDEWEDVWPYNSYNYLVGPNNKTWAEAAATEEWCSGSGTWNDPYIIENVYIDCQNEGSGIYISLSNVSFIIRNCYIENSGQGEFNTGISLVHVRNGQVINNNISFTEHAIWLSKSYNNTISDNRMLANHNRFECGGKVVKLVESHNNTISRNRSKNHYDGIVIWEGEFNIITENFIETNIFGHFPDTGLFLYKSNYSTISYNLFAGDYATYYDPTADSMINVLGGFGNVIENNFNEESNNANLSTSSDTNILRLGGIDSFFVLSDCYHNYVYGNGIYLPEAPTNLIIIGYVLYVLIGLLGLVSIAYLIFRWKKKSTSEINFKFWK